MLGFSHAPELLILLVIAFLVFGPEKLPELARGAGRGLREFRRMSSELQQLSSTLIQEPVQEMQQQLQDVARMAQEPFLAPLGHSATAPPHSAMVNPTLADAQPPEFASPVADEPAAPSERRLLGLGGAQPVAGAPLAAGAGGALSLQPVDHAAAIGETEPATAGHGVTAHGPIGAGR